ncbi:universal stress protein [Actinoplanes oblitus]|uniref:Universal stress protein n=1 Tax=Actinoplanes oblitus TaxID=3040509 RepID=A0ABY8W5R9_9ACTN|nr:universal stress protein [Actinoplanes oblitus]WIM92857.1 universal stress protein [Actinoplanes oblitus]
MAGQRPARAGEPVLVGTDGSAPAQAAVRWAAVEAQRRGTTLTVLCAYDPAGAALPWRSRQDPATAAVLAEATVADARAALGALAPTVSVRTVVAPGQPAAVLLQHSGDAGLLVVGHRGRGGLTSLLLGSVGQRVSTHARCTTAVVRGRSFAIDGPVVVGVDSSPGGRAALRAALDAARLRHAPVLALHAYAEALPPVASGLHPTLPTGPEELAKSRMDEVVGLLAGGQADFPDVQVRSQVAAGSAAGLLVGASYHAQLMVVGNHGRGSPLGSVGQQLLHHADCPVLIAR